MGKDADVPSGILISGGDLRRRQEDCHVARGLKVLFKRGKGFLVVLVIQVRDLRRWCRY